MKKLIGAVLAMCMVMLFLQTASAEEYSCFFQTDSDWADVPYGKGPDGPTTIGPAGCGLLSLTNAVYALNGVFLDPSDLAAWSLSHGCRIDGKGTTPDFPEKYINENGASIGVKCDGTEGSINDTVRTHIQNNGVAVINVVEHFACLVDYDPSTGKYLALDSYPSSNRYTYPDGKAWLTVDQLTNHWKWATSYVTLLSNTANREPYGQISAAMGGEGTVSFVGWVKNDSKPNEPIELHLYVGGEKGRVDHCYTGIWSNPSDNSFAATVNVSERGEQNIYLYAIGGSNPEIGRGTVTIYDTNTNRKPKMNFEECISGNGRVYVKGWAFDPDEPSSALTVLFYAQTSSGELIGLGGKIANEESNDVHRVYQCGNNHRFSGYIGLLGYTGTFTIHAVALDTEQSGDNALWLNHSGITVAGEKNPPTISNVRITDIDNSGYTVRAKVMDDSGVNALTVLVYNSWNEAGYPAFTAYTAQNSGDEYYYRVNRSTSQNNYWTDFHAWDHYGNVKKEEGPCVNVKWNTVSFNGSGVNVSPANKQVICAYTNINGSKTFFSNYDDLPKPSRTGYTFDGWYTQASGGTEITSTSQVIIIGDHTLYAHWTANKYQLDMNVLLDDVLEASPTGKIFMCDLYINDNLVQQDVADSCGYWDYGSKYEFKNIRATSPYVYDGIVSGSLSGTIPADYHEVCLRFVTGKYTVSYNANAGVDAVTNMPSDQIKIRGTDLTISEKVPKREGYVFMGWGASAETQSAAYQPGNPYRIDESISLYAIWKLDTFTIAYDANGGQNAPDSQTKVRGKTLTLAEAIPDNGEYVFTGWNTKANGSGDTYQPSGEYTQDVGATLYAQWRELYKLVLPDGVKVIEEEAFVGVNAEIIVIPEGCVEIGQRAFKDCKKVQKVYIPASVKTIAFNVFSGRGNLVIYAPSGSEAISFAEELGIPYVVTGE